MKRAVLFVGLFLIVAANVLMMYYAPYGLVRNMEAYQNVVNNTNVAANNTNVAANNTNVAVNNTNVGVNNNAAYNNTNYNNVEGFQNVVNNSEYNNTGNNAVVNNAVVNNSVNNTGYNNTQYNNTNNSNVAVGGRNATVGTPAEGFSSYNVSNAGGAKDVYQPIGQYDGVKLSTGNSVSSWRYTAPNEPLTGAEFVPGDNELFMFKNNQCKPECCGASFSCGGGCVCTTPKQRQYIAERGGNRTAPEDSA